MLDQIDARIGSVTAGGAYDVARTYDTVAARAGDIPVIIPPLVTAVLRATADLPPSQRGQHIAVITSELAPPQQPAINWLDVTATTICLTIIIALTI